MHPPSALGRVLLLSFLLLILGYLLCLLCFLAARFSLLLDRVLGGVGRLLDDVADGLLEGQGGVSPLEDDSGDGTFGVPLPGVGREVRDGDRGVEEVVQEERDVRSRREGEGADCRAGGKAGSARAGFPQPGKDEAHRASCRSGVASRRLPTRRWRG